MIRTGIEWCHCSGTSPVSNHFEVGKLSGGALWCENTHVVWPLNANLQHSD